MLAALGAWEHHPADSLPLLGSELSCAGRQFVVGGIKAPARWVLRP